MTENAPLVVMANRLPVRGVERNGQWEWSLSSGGLVSALVPVLGDVGGGVDRMGGHQRRRGRRAVESRGHRAPGGADQRGGVRGVLSGLRQRDAVAALSRRDPAADVRSGLVARLRHGQRALRGGGSRRRGTGSHGLDPRLSAPARPVDAAEAPTRRAHRVLPAHPVPARELFLQLPWRREILEGLLGADLVGFQVPGAASNFARLARHVAGATGTDALVHFEGREIRVGRVSDLRRRRRAHGAGGRSRRAGEGAPAPRRARRSAVRAARRRPSRLHEGHRSAAASRW